MNMIDDTGGKETSATRTAYLALRNMILTGAIPAGKKLKIEELRGLLETGASPVREALSLLTSDMLVERIDQRGFRSAPASAENFAEILNLRCVLEDMALRQSIFSRHCCVGRAACAGASPHEARSNRRDRSL